jgi:glycosyltransferase involved in cell wall biosynthesis
MRAAIVHYCLLDMRGAERVVEALCRLLPDADLFTLFYDPSAVSPLIRSRSVTTSFLNPLRRWHRGLLPLAPFALESLDLRGYDLVISSESRPAKGVLVDSNAQHVCYCHSPMRYLWHLYPAYLHDWTPSLWKKIWVAALASPFRVWDHATAARVDEFVANSANVQRRIWRSYRRPAQVVHPPVPVETFSWRAPDDYYLLVSELVAHKRVADAVRSFSQTGRRLKIVGLGPEYRRLRRLAKRNVEFCGRVGAGELRHLYSHSRAVLIPAEEDFGMVAVEAMASGKAVIALGRGGVLEALPPDPSASFLYPEPGEVPLGQAVHAFEQTEPSIRRLALQTWASRFSESQFRIRMAEVLGLAAGQPYLLPRARIGVGG